MLNLVRIEQRGGGGKKREKKKSNIKKIQFFLVALQPKGKIKTLLKLQEQKLKEKFIY